MVGFLPLCLALSPLVSLHMCPNSVGRVAAALSPFVSPCAPSYVLQAGFGWTGSLHSVSPRLALSPLLSPCLPLSPVMCFRLGSVGLVPAALSPFVSCLPSYLLPNLRSRSSVGASGWFRVDGSCRLVPLSPLVSLPVALSPVSLHMCFRLGLGGLYLHLSPVAASPGRMLAGVSINFSPSKCLHLSPGADRSPGRTLASVAFTCLPVCAFIRLPALPDRRAAFTCLPACAFICAPDRWAARLPAHIYLSPCVCLDLSPWCCQIVGPH